LWKLSTLVINTGMDLAILSLAGFVAVLALGWLFLRQLRVLLHTIPDPQPLNSPSESRPDAIDKDFLLRIEALEREVPLLFGAVAEGIDHVDRNEKRVRGIVVGAQKRFEASDYFDPGVDAEADTLPRDDEGSIEEEGVLPLSDDMGEPSGAWGAVPGMMPDAVV